MKITKRVTICYLLLLSVLLSPLTAQAGFINLSPTSAVSDVNDGDTISFDVVMDFTADPTLGGGFDIAYDESALQLTGFNRFDVGDPVFGSDPGIFSGLLSGWSFGTANFFAGISGPAILGNVTFQVLTTMGANTSVSTQDTVSTANPFTSSATFSQQLVDFNSVNIARAINSPQPNPQPNPQPAPIPEPATFMLFGLGLLIAGAQRIKK